MIDIPDIIESAARLVDNGFEVEDEYRRGVVELATLLCLGYWTADMVAVMGYAVCGVHKPRQEIANG